MTVRELMEKINIQLIAGEEGLDEEIKGGYIGDLLSFVMAHAREKEVWITIQGHINAIAVAVMVGASAVILAEGVVADETMIIKANQEGIPLFTTEISSFDLVVQMSKYL